MENWLALFGICGSFFFPHAVSCLFGKNFQACSGRTFTVVQIRTAPG